MISNFVKSNQVSLNDNSGAQNKSLMKRIAIFLRKELPTNRFSDAVLAALNNPDVDEMTLCSGFFQEDNSYSVSTSKFNLTPRCHKKLDLKIVGYYGWHQHKAFSQFVTNVAAINCSHCVNVSSFRIPGDKWHAKICIAKKSGKPVFAAIGSSNITRRAFDVITNFNYESDVIFWDEKDATISQMVESVIGESADEFPSVVVTKYDGKHRANRVPLQERLLTLEKEIFSKAVPYP